MENKTMEELIVLCQEKNEDAYTELYKRYYPVAYRMAFHISNSDADAKDAASEAMISVYEHIQELRFPQYFLLWLKRIVVGSCNRIFRKNTHVDYIPEDSTLMMHSLDESMEHNPEMMVHYTSDQELLQFFISLLPEEQATVVNMFYFDELSIKEIADQIGVSEGTVKSRLFATKKKLKEMISEYEEDEDILLNFKSDALLAFLSRPLLEEAMHQNSVKKRMNQIGASMQMKAVSLVLCGLIACTVGYKIYQSFQKDHTTDEEDSHLVETRNYPENQKQFPAVVINHKEITNAQDAYFTLLLIIDDEKQLDTLSNTEQENIEALTSALREYGGPYYELLQNQGWE